ncbi:MAG: DJ-1/PfpI family protein [Candidatus Aenigmarchaeota archaeon]|nr:DJ-1/PfpI family protein [Candidatus Aenigmarchaeota archaeon]
MRIIIPLADGFDEFQASAVFSILRKARIDVVTAGVPATIVRGRHGMKLIADKQLDEADYKTADGMVLVGGDSNESLERSEKLKQAIIELDGRKKIIGAVENAPYLLARAGVLDDRVATIAAGMEKHLARPRTGRVIVDGHVVTAAGTPDSVELAIRIVEMAGKKAAASDIRKEFERHGS